MRKCVEILENLARKVLLEVTFKEKLEWSDGAVMWMCRGRKSRKKGTANPEVMTQEY